MSVLWGLGAQQADVGAQFRDGFDRGRAQRRQNALLDARRQLAMDPNSQPGFNALAQIDPAAAMQYRGQLAQQQTQATERQQQSIRIGARIVRQINPQDQAGWDRALAAARQAGVDINGVPPAFDPSYRDQLLAAGQAMETQQQGDGYTLSPGQVRYGANNEVVARGPAERPRYFPIAPGGYLAPEPGAGAPSQAPPPPAAGAVEEWQGRQYRFRGGDVNDPANWEPIGGAPSSNEAPAFRPAPGGAVSGQQNFP